MPSLREALQQTHQILEASGIPDARLEAEVMVMNVMRMPRQDIFAQQELAVSSQQQETLSQVIDRRKQREPLAYILGYKEFYGVNLLVTPDVLIPRPETETLVEHALFMSLMGMEVAHLVIADVGTGTGAIALNLAIHLPAARIYATDSSEKALMVANYNIRRHNVADRVTLCHGDLMEPLPEPVDLIVANLPYIPTARIPTLQPEIQWEPAAALDGGEQGMDQITRLIAQASERLNPQGSILLEMDPEQVPLAEELARQYFPEAETGVERDLAGLDRVLTISRGVAEEA
ncbi:Release factor glutamine methyltransferase [Geodia barretti]|uniref:peptide chain release factor N(5)-glutamine methyltransferase n=1 Tax=Geodia barretti TaxID=519541 RepID=A0AA35RZC8_GEOBA|nr:Release factor glutamine methyltransferase [Geodia barretti]